MCLSPIDIINPSKYISLKHRDQYILQVPCGHCAECQQTLSNQWFFRIFHEWIDIQNQKNGYVYFDTLTYSPEHLPYMDDILPYMPHEPCFRPSDIRQFIQNLRDRLKSRNASFRYFIVSEYGSKYKRPHYHLLLFVNGIEPVALSMLIDDIWKYGRTDGVTYKGAAYVMNHNVKDNSIESMLVVSNYVCKYIQKSCIYDQTLSSRLDKAMNLLHEQIAPNDDDWLSSPQASRYRSEFKRSIAQRHWQSQHFGESALANIDLDQLFKDGCLFMPSPKAVKIPVALSTYYKRKLFYELVEVDGVKSWQLTELGRQYKKYRRNYLVNQLADTFKCVGLIAHLDYDWLELANYVYNQRGRINGHLDESTLEERLNSGIDLYNYVTLTDKEDIGTGLSPQFHGNNTIGYNGCLTPSNSFSIRKFIASHVIIDDEKENQLNQIYTALSKIGHGKQKAFELKQRLTDLFKVFE